jgi:hypothetical protein
LDLRGRNKQEVAEKCIMRSFIRMGWAVHVARMEEKCVKGFGGDHKVKRPLGRLRRTWEDNIKMNVKEVEGGVD